ncbi:hypothetical protein T439DRAFT_327040 [Meredithblackwellia eburnea MCA 4105]
MVSFNTIIALTLMSFASTVVANPPSQGDTSAGARLFERRHVEKETFKVEKSLLHAGKELIGGVSRNFKRKPYEPKRPMGGGARNFKREPYEPIKRPYGGGARNFV